MDDIGCKQLSLGIIISSMYPPQPRMPSLQMKVYILGFQILKMVKIFLAVTIASWMVVPNKKTPFKVMFSQPSRKGHMSNEKILGWLGLLGIILPRYIGIIMNHYKDPY